MTTLSDTQVARYARHILLKEVGGHGQERLLAASVAIGGTARGAEEAARYLTAAGVGHLVVEDGLADRLGATLGRMNPDVCLVPADAADLGRGPDGVITPCPADDRLAGALAAQAALVRLTRTPTHDEEERPWRL